MHRLLIIADDLTGAADCGVACASQGLNSVVVLGGAGDETDADILSIDANTRGLSAEAAAAETSRLVRRYMGSECLLFKKLDSSLRGNVAAELAAALAARRDLAMGGKRIVALLAPAFPATGRTTVNGQQLIHGRSPQESESQRSDRLCCRSNLSEILRDEGLSSALVDIPTIRSGASTLRNSILRLANEADVLVCDSETDHDLYEIASAAMLLGPRTVWAGSAGLAHHLPLAAGIQKVTVSIPDQPLAAGPTLFVVGSRSAASRRQVELLADSPDVVTIAISPQSLIDQSESTALHDHQLELSNALAAGQDVAVLLTANPSVETEDAPLLSAALAQLVTHCAHRVGALVATGGETARAVLEVWGISQLHLVRELEPGLPISLTRNWTRRLPVLTKAGSFGTAQTLLHCGRFLHELNRCSTANLYGEQEA